MGTISLFNALTFKPVIAWKQRRSIRTCRICSSFASQNKIVSSTNKRCETPTPPPYLPATLNPRSKLAPSALFIILLKTSIITRNNIGDSGSPCFKPLELPKKSVGDPLNKTENWTVDMQVWIHLHHLTPKPILFNKSRRASPVHMIVGFLDI